MFSPTKILSWLETNVKKMRCSRRKTLSVIVCAAMELNGLGVLALGRAMRTQTTAKHNIKRVNGFLGNEALEVEAIAQGLFEDFAPTQGRVFVLADWTDVANGKLLVFALPCNGRSIPFFTKVVAKKAGEGAIKKAEQQALKALKRICCNRTCVVIVADRGFGNKRWLADVRACGFHFVQRLSNVFNVDTEEYIGALNEMNLRRGKRVRDWGKGTIGDDEIIVGRLVTAFDKKAKEPWYLVTDLDDATAAQIVNMYRRRWWIETTFRDKKNRDWGMKLHAVKLKNYKRYERLFYITALAFIFLSAFGAAAEAQGYDKGLKANTRKIRVLNLLRIGHHFIERYGGQWEYALEALRELATRKEAPNWG